VGREKTYRLKIKHAKEVIGRKQLTEHKRARTLSRVCTKGLKSFYDTHCWRPIPEPEPMGAPGFWQGNADFTFCVFLRRQYPHVDRAFIHVAGL
jgi:hypothetical protein